MRGGKMREGKIAARRRRAAARRRREVEDSPSSRPSGGLPLPPILLVHGRMDCVVPTPQSLRLLHVLRNVSASPAELRLLPRAGHFFEPEPSLVRVMRRFIER